MPLNFPVVFTVGPFFYDTTGYMLLYIYPAWDSLTFLNLWINVFYQLWKTPLPLQILPQLLPSSPLSGTPVICILHLLSLSSLSLSCSFIVFISSVCCAFWSVLFDLFCLQCFCSDISIYWVFCCSSYIYHFWKYYLIVIQISYTVFYISYFLTILSSLYLIYFKLWILLF